MVDGLPRAASGLRLFGLLRRRTLSTFSKSNTLDHAGQVERQLGLRLFIKTYHKHGDIFFDSRAISMRVVVNGDMIYNFMHAKREVWEKSVARERAGPRF